MSRPTPTALRRTLVGDFQGERAVVLTPIGAMFRRFHAHNWRASHATGWWPRLERDGVHVILIPQGAALLDLCPALESTPRVHLLGYAGALSTKVEVGEIASPGVATLLGTDQRWELVGDPNLIVTSVPHLLAGYASAEGRAVSGQLADMEAAHLAAGLAPGQQRLSVRVLVSDRWPDEPFHVDSAERLALLRRRRDDLVDACVEELG